ncbi:hypothetical protein ARMSODRAFT_974556 [Armillaria solidipes]|uniref:Uncharacterized protein n=1 Tax=Armillaria solidipes TaxID=1076256 RepID=A0A2H3BZP1_9AGAR|nr:hypothetical protein ARMSODRAFT_974556 [Armillaria solidipes]
MIPPLKLCLMSVIAALVRRGTHKCGVACRRLKVDSIAFNISDTFEARRRVQKVVQTRLEVKVLEKSRLLGNYQPNIVASNCRSDDFGIIPGFRGALTNAVNAIVAARVGPVTSGGRGQRDHPRWSRKAQLVDVHKQSAMLLAAGT